MVLLLLYRSFEGLEKGGATLLHLHVQVCALRGDRPSKDDDSAVAKPSCLLNSDESLVAPFFLSLGNL